MMVVLKACLGLGLRSDASRPRSKFLSLARVRVPLVVLPAVILSACASNKVAVTDGGVSPADQGKLNVSYTRDLPGGAALKEIPTEVTIVKRRTTENNVAAQVGMNILLAALGGASIHTFSKNDLKGEKIEGLENRQNIANPIPHTFVDALRAKVNAAIQADPALGQKAAEEELFVSGGSSRLIYENLSGNSEERFRLKTELYVWSKSKGFNFGFGAPKTVDCSETTSDLLTQDQWAADEYALVKTKLDATLRDCQDKVITQLSALLNG